jgi:hypothetical protein
MYGWLAQLKNLPSQDLRTSAENLRSPRGQNVESNLHHHEENEGKRMNRQENN